VGRRCAVSFFDDDDSLEEARAKAEESVWGRLAWAFQDQHDERIKQIEDAILAETGFPVTKGENSWKVTMFPHLPEGTIIVSEDVWKVLEVHSKNDTAGMFRAMLRKRAESRAYKP
jgi:hypothetical protein